MAKDVTYQIKIGIDTSGLRKRIQEAVNEATSNSPVQLSNITISSSALKTALQEALTKATSSTPLSIKSIKISNEALNELQSQLKKSPITLTISKIDATSAVQRLRTQLQTMLSGLSITGLKEFLGADAATSALQSATEAANKLAQAQENVRKKTAEASAATAELSNLQKLVNTATTGAGRLISDDTVTLLKQASELTQRIANAKTLTGQQQAQEVANIRQGVAMLTQEVNMRQQSAKMAEKLAAASRQRVSTEREIANTITQTNNLQAQINAWIKNNANAYQVNKTQVDGMNQSLDQVRAALSGSNVDLNEQKDILAQVRAAFSGVKNEAMGLGVATKSVFSKMASWAKTIASVAGFTSVIGTLRMAFNKMYTEVKEVDAAFVEFRKVTDLSATSYQMFANTAAQAAATVGASYSSMLSASADFARLGFNAEDAGMLAQAALLYMNVGDGITDISFATSSLISTMKAFRLEAADATSIIDKFNEVGSCA